MRILIFLLLLVPSATRAADPPVSAAEMSELFKSLLLSNLPTPLYAKDINWGKQREVVVGVKWHRDGLILKPEAIKKLHNDGTWRQLRVEADAPTKTLQLGVSELKTVEEGKVTFDVNVNFPVHLYFEQQIWESGVRLYSGSTRARCKVGAILKCETTSKLEFKNGSFLPEVTVRTRVTEAHLGYDELVVEHTLGVGGDAAKLIGEAVIDTVKQVKPSIEEELLIRGNKAIVKAGDTKEVKLKLGKLFGGK